MKVPNKETIWTKKAQVILEKCRLKIAVLKTLLKVVFWRHQSIDNKVSYANMVSYSKQKLKILFINNFL